MIKLNLDRMGIPGVAGLGLLLFCLSFYLGNVIPAEQLLTTSKDEETQLIQTSAKQSDRLHSTILPERAVSLPQMSDVPELLMKLNSIADQHNITIGHVSYHLSEKDKQRKFEVNLPLQGRYLELRAYLHDALSIAPAISLDEVSMQRSSSSEPQIEVRIRLSYYLSNP